mmetsp:Transcript_11535/g.53623  ORF Transcript_11535/g.53623 Transcript_11535/m.53623 type:complete len:302 (-) Transcript_11535:1187-2092(-)
MAKRSLVDLDLLARENVTGYLPVLCSVNDFLSCASSSSSARRRPKSSAETVSSPSGGSPGYLTSTAMTKASAEIFNSRSETGFGAPSSSVNKGVGWRSLSLGPCMSNTTSLVFISIGSVASSEMNDTVTSCSRPGNSSPSVSEIVNCVGQSSAGSSSFHLNGSVEVFFTRNFRTSLAPAMTRSKASPVSSSTSTDMTAVGVTPTQDIGNSNVPGLSSTSATMTQSWIENGHGPLGNADTCTFLAVAFSVSPSWGSGSPSAVSPSAGGVSPSAGGSPSAGASSPSAGGSASGSGGHSCSPLG